MKELCEKYQSIIREHFNVLNLKAEKCDDPKCLDDPTFAFIATTAVAQHMLWILDEIPKLEDIGICDVDIDDRWTILLRIRENLGFVKGWMWSQGMISLRELQEDTL